MKITLTPLEAAELIRETLYKSGLHPNVEVKSVDVVIDAPAPPPPTDRVQLNLMELVEIVRGWVFADARNTSRKISAIKAVREAAERHGFFIGLGDAKRFVDIFIP